MLVLGVLKKQGCLIRGMGKVGTFGGTLFLILGVLFLIGWFGAGMGIDYIDNQLEDCLLYTSPSPRDYAASRMPSSA